MLPDVSEFVLSLPSNSVILLSGLFKRDVSTEGQIYASFMLHLTTGLCTFPSSLGRRGLLQLSWDNVSECLKVDSPLILLSQQLRSDLTDRVTVATVAALVALVLLIVKRARCPTVNLCLPTKNPSKPTPPSTDSTVQYSTQDTPRQTSSDASDPTDQRITSSPTASSPHPAPSGIKARCTYRFTGLAPAVSTDNNADS